MKLVNSTTDDDIGAAIESLCDGCDLGLEEIINSLLESDADTPAETNNNRTDVDMSKVQEDCDDCDNDEDVDIEGDIYLTDDDSALEGVNIDTARLIRADDVNKARRLVKEAKKLMKKHRPASDYDEAAQKLTEARALIWKMKIVVDNSPEPVGIKERLLAALTPIFSLLPESEITNITVLPDGNGGFYYQMNTTKYSDHMSSSTRSHVKRSIQYRFNLFLHNLDKYERTAKELSKRTKSAKATESLYEDATDEDEEVSQALESVLSTVLEGQMTTAQRKALPDSMFGLPETRKYPLDAPERIESAKKFFKYCPEKNRKELADNMIKRMKQLHMPIEFGSKLVISKYVDPKYVVDNDEVELNPKTKK